MRSVTLHSRLFGERALNYSFHSQAKSLVTKYLFTTKAGNILGTCIFAFSIWSSYFSVVKAETPQEVPDQLTEVIAEIENAANEQDLDRLMEYYDSDFMNEDGLTYNTVRTALQQMWSDYSQLTYDTEINSWEQKEDELIAETTTIITGKKNSEGSLITLESNLKSRQYFQDQKLVRQEILAEETKMFKGENPPQIQVNVPDTVKVGERYYFDTIVTQPLEGKVLLGGAIEERINVNLYAKPSNLELERLAAGGIFKVVTAPLLSDNHWLSAIIVGGEGVTMVTKRVRVEDNI